MESNRAPEFHFATRDLPYLTSFKFALVQILGLKSSLIFVGEGWLRRKVY